HILPNQQGITITLVTMKRFEVLTDLLTLRIRTTNQGVFGRSGSGFLLLLPEIAVAFEFLEFIDLDIPLSHTVEEIDRGFTVEVSPQLIEDFSCSFYSQYFKFPLHHLPAV